MPNVFKWSGKSPKGEVLKGEFTASSKEEVQTYLRKQRIVPTKIAQKSAALFGISDLEQALDSSDNAIKTLAEAIAGEDADGDHGALRHASHHLPDGQQASGAGR